MLNKKIKIILTGILLFSFVITGAIQAQDEVDELLDPDNYDFGGKTVTIVDWSWNDPFGEDADREVLERKEEAEEKFNTTIETIGVGWGGAHEDMISRLMSGDSNWDIWLSYTFHYWPLVGNNALYPLSDILPDAYYEKFKISREGLEKALGYKGKIYGFTDPHPGLNTFLIWWNKDMFEKAGLPNLYEVYEEGNWTWEKMTEFLEELTKDTDGDGEIDQWGLGDAQALEAAAFSNNASPLIEDENGNKVYNLDSPEYREFLHQINDWYEEGYLLMFENMVELFSEGRVAMNYKSFGNINEVQEAGMEDDYGLIPFPKGPNADSHVSSTSGYATRVLPANVENPEGLIALYHYVFGEDDVFVNDEDLQEEIMKRVKDEKSFEIAMEAVNNFSGESLNLYEAVKRGFVGEGYGEELSYNLIRGDTEIGSTVEEYKPEVQSVIDEVLGQ